MSVFILAVILLCTSISLHFWVLKPPFEILFLRHLHSLVPEPGAFQLVGSPQGIETCWFLVSLNQIVAWGQVYPHRPTDEDTENPVVSIWCLWLQRNWIVFLLYGWLCKVSLLPKDWPGCVVLTPAFNTGLAVLGCVAVCCYWAVMGMEKGRWQNGSSVWHQTGEG